MTTGDRPGANGGRKDGASSSVRASGRGRTPEQTKDDTDEGWGDWRESHDDRDRWLEEQRPPHWG